MSDDLKDKLCPERKIPLSTGSVLWRNVLMIFAVSLHYFAMGLNTYSINEYTHKYVKDQLFPNETLQSNFSACRNHNISSPAYMKYTRVQQISADWQMYNTLAAAIPAVITNAVYPSYTDVYGRKFLYVSSSIGLLLKYSLSSAVIYAKGSLWIIVVGFLLQGVTGSSHALLSVTFSTIADTTESGQQRSFLIALVEAVLKFMSTASGFVAGFFIENTGYFYPSMTASIMAVVSTILLFIQRESLSEDKRSSPSSILKYVKRTVNFYTSKEFKGNRSLYILLLTSFVVADLTGVHRSSLETLYQLGMPFCWTPTQIGYFSALGQIGQGVLGIGAIKLLQKCMTDDVIGIFSTVTNAGSLVLEGFANTNTLLYLVPVPAMFSFMTTPMIRGLMSSMTPEDKQGALFASISTVHSACWLIATVADNNIYSATISILNGFVFLVLATLSIIAALLLCLFRMTHMKQKNSSNTTVQKGKLHEPL